jgi:hypothetical protein
MTWHKPGLIGAALTLWLAGPSQAGTVAVRFQEGVTRAFPVVRTVTHETLAQGDLTQLAHGHRVVSRLVFRFKDGSLHDETVVYSQREVFTLLNYRIVQRGPSFPETLEAWVDRDTERYEVRHRPDEDSPEEFVSGRFILPADAYNGLLSVVIKNLGGSEETVSVVAFTPTPRVVKLKLLPLAEDRSPMAGAPLPTIRYQLRPELGQMKSLLVGDVADMLIWILPGEAPAFLRAEGPLYFMGPVWRIDPH